MRAAAATTPAARRRKQNDPMNRARGARPTMTIPTKPERDQVAPCARACEEYANGVPQAEIARRQRRVALVDRGGAHRLDRVKNGRQFGESRKASVSTPDRGMLSAVSIALRPVTPADTDFARVVHHLNYRDVVERQFGFGMPPSQDRQFAESWADGATTRSRCAAASLAAT